MIAFFAIALIVLMVYLAKLGGISRKVDLSFLTSRKLIRIGKYSLYSALGTLGSLLIFRMDAVMITGLLGEVSTGLYFNILVMAAVIDIPSQAIGKIAGPIISKSFNDNNHEEVQSIYIKGSINSLIVGMLIFLGIWFNLDAIISLSSKPEAFFGATQIFLFLGIAKLIDGLTGINTHILLYSRYYKFNLLFLLCLGVLNVFLNLVLIKQFDIAGAAMATLISLTLYNFIKLFFIKFTLILKLKLLLGNFRAALAESFKIPGPLIPQCVTNNGPSDWSLVPCIFTMVFSTTIPINSFTVSFGILKVNKDGTGSSILCPKCSNHLSPERLGEPPVVTITLVNSSVLSSAK